MIEILIPNHRYSCCSCQADWVLCWVEVIFSTPLFSKWSKYIYVNQIPSHPGRPLFECCIKCLVGTRLFKRKMSFSSFLFILMKNAKFLRPSIVHVNDWHSQSYISKRFLEKFWNQVCFYRTSSFFSWWYETTEDIDVEKIT